MSSTNGSFWFYISNNVAKFQNLAKDQNWSAKEAVISVRDLFSISETEKGSKYFSGEINTLVCFNECGDLEILNVSIDPDLFKIINANDKVLSNLKDYFGGLSKIEVNERRVKRLRNRVSIYYNMLIDLSRSTNQRHYDMFLSELLVMLESSGLPSKKRRSISI